MKRLVFIYGARGCAPGNAITRRNLDESDEGGIGLLCGWHADWAAAARGGARAGRGHEMSDWEEISDQRAAELRDIARGRRKCIPMRAMATQTAMLKWLKIHSASRPEAPSQAEQIERPKSDDVHSTSMELEMTYLKDPPTPTENGQSPISADTSANIGMILGRILNRLSRIETE